MPDVTERMRKGLFRMEQAAHGKPDRVPVYAQMSNHSAKLSGETTFRFFTDAEVFVECELAADEMYGFDAPTIHYDCYNIEAEALGGKLVFKGNEVPDIDPSRPVLSSVKTFKDLKPLRPGKSGRMPFVLEINKRLIDLGLAPKIRFCGTFTLAVKLLGYENLINAVYSAPDDVHRFMCFLTDEVIAPWIDCQRLDCGVKGTATGSEAMASPPLATVGMIRDFSLRYAKRLEKSVGGIRLAGIWGESVLNNPADLLDIKSESCSGMIQVCDPDVTVLGPAYFKEYADRNDVGLIMGLDAGFIKTGHVDEIKERAKLFIEEAAMDGRFVLFINDIPYDTPPENVHAVAAAAHESVYS
jgi:uroporphyrinogen-III decarboxylase